MNRDHVRLTVAMVATVCFLVGPAVAQPGSVILAPVDLDAQTLNNGHLGCAELNGVIYVSARGSAGTTAAPHTVFMVNGMTGVVFGSFLQDPGTSASPWGYRDGATDGTNLMFGLESGIYVIEGNHSSPTVGSLVTTVVAANGPQTLTANPITGAGLPIVGNYRAVAFDPSGNTGNGSIWTASFGSDLIEIDLDGNVLTQWPVAGQWSLYGLALDPVTGHLWGHSGSGALIEIDKSTGLVTGRSLPNPSAGGAQGGLSVVDSSANALDLVYVMQGDPTLGGAVDSVSSILVHRYNQAEPFLVGRVNGGPGKKFGETQEYLAGDTLTWEYDLSYDPAGLAGRPTFLALNIEGDAAIDGNTLGIPDIHFLSNFSAPVGAAAILADGFAVAGLFGIDYTALGLGQPFLSDGVALGIAGPVLTNVGDLIRLQAIYAEPLGVLMGGVAAASTQIKFKYAIPPSIVCSATGSNSFNSDTTSGFFKFEHLGGGYADIISLVCDWSTSSNPNQSNMEFDTDQTGMADVFEGGNSAVAGCFGTYRNGSDVATGLRYDALNTVPATPCDPLALTGWIGTNPVGTAGDYQTLQFLFCCNTFVGGTTFEWDCDTDLGQGTTGAAMEGLVITITFADLSSLSGELAVDPETPNRSVLKFF